MNDASVHYDTVKDTFGDELTVLSSFSACAVLVAREGNDEIELVLSRDAVKKLRKALKRALAEDGNVER